MTTDEAIAWFLGNLSDLSQMRSDMTMDKATVIRRIAAETTPGSDKEQIAVKLAAFVFGYDAECFQYLVDDERNAVSGPSDEEHDFDPPPKYDGF